MFRLICAGFDLAIDETLCKPCPSVCDEVVFIICHKPVGTASIRANNVLAVQAFDAESILICVLPAHRYIES